jgi:hypothetical protein
LTLALRLIEEARTVARGCGTPSLVSGGIFNARGQLVAIEDFALREFPELSLGVPAGRIRQALRDYARHGPLKGLPSESAECNRGNCAAAATRGPTASPVTDDRATLPRPPQEYSADAGGLVNVLRRVEVTGAKL